MWIMIAGPWGTGAPTAGARAANLEALNRAALAVFEAGHVPVVGVNLCLPIIEAAGGRAGEIMMPLSLALAERCDACLRIGGASEGADREVARFRAAGKPVFRGLAEIPAS